MYASSALGSENLHFLQNKVLPGDKSGLPWEVWQIILSYLSATDLCHSACVSKVWSDLVVSVDTLRWKQLYLSCSEWRHPLWPLKTQTEPHSWRLSYKDQYLSTRFWKKREKLDVKSKVCSAIFSKKVLQKTIHVGPTCIHQSLKSALSVTNGYDRIVVHPGIYDEHCDVITKVPMELVGAGELGSVILVVGIQQVAQTARLSNLVLRAPWFTSFIFMIKSGYVQINNCIIEDGMICALHPSSVHIKFCTFRHASVILQHTNASIIENCEFSQSDAANVIVEGQPKEEKNWAFSYLHQRMKSIYSSNSSTRMKFFKTGSLTSTIQSSFTEKSLITDTSRSRIIEENIQEKTVFSHFQASNLSEIVQNETKLVNDLNETKNYDKNRSRSIESHVEFSIKENVSYSKNDKTENNLENVCFYSESKPSTKESLNKTKECDQINSNKFENKNHEDVLQEEQNYLFVNNSHELVDTKSEFNKNEINQLSDNNTNSINECLENSSHTNDIKETFSDMDTYPNKSENCLNYKSSKILEENSGDNIPSCSTWNLDARHVLPNNGRNENDLEMNILKADDSVARHPNIPYHMRRSQSEEILPLSDDDLSILDELDSSEDSDSFIFAGDHPLDYSSSSEDDCVQIFSDSDVGFSTSEESVIMLPHLRDDSFHQLTSPRAVQAEVASITSEHTQSLHIDVLADPNMRSYVDEVQGCLIHHCRMNHSKGGLVISLQAHAIVSDCSISNLGYGIRCIQNSKVIVLKNKIHHCRTSGIFIRQSSSGLIAGNDIYSNNEAGIDIRKNADPLVQHNQIHHGKRSGVVVLGSGRGLIHMNDIYSNKEAGVYVLYDGNPTIRKNNIFDGKATGIAINAGGRGTIIDNVIQGNRWAGIDIRNGRSPLVAGNSILDGSSDGLVIGVDGSGIIENNLISGNSACGIWSISGKHLYIHGNKICHSGQTGISLLEKNKQCLNNHLGQMVTTVNSRAYDQYEEESIDQSLASPYSQTVLQHNYISNNKAQGVFVELNEEVLLQNNAVVDNKLDGILMSQDAPSWVLNNNLSSNGQNGLTTSLHNEISVKGNGMYENKKNGVVCRNVCTLVENDVINNVMAAVCAQGNAKVELRENRLCSSNMAAVKSGERTNIVSENNKIFTIGGEVFDCDGTLEKRENKVIEVKVPPPSPKRNEKGQDTQFDKNTFLKNPEPRPLLVATPPATDVPAHHTAIVTKLMVPSGETCEKGSRFCIII